MRCKLLPVLAVLCMLLLFLPGCGSKNAIGQRPAVQSGELQFTGPQPGDTVAIFDTSKGEICAVLYPSVAPMAVDNFIGLAQQGYYNGTTFHKVVFGGFIQGGDATGTGNGSATIWNADSFPLEASERLRHYAGALCVAFDRDTGLGTGQFYIVTAAPDSVGGDQARLLGNAGYSTESTAAYQAAGGLPQLDNTDTVFGQIYRGQGIADAISAVTADENGRPAQSVTINSITITTYTED